jgi:hypothetical protein
MHSTVKCTFRLYLAPRHSPCYDFHLLQGGYLLQAAAGSALGRQVGASALVVRACGAMSATFKEQCEEPKAMISTTCIGNSTAANCPPS